MYRFFVAALCAGLLRGQARQSPQELLKQAITFQQQGKLEEAIHDYDLFLDMYPDAPQVRSNLGAALVAAGHYAQAIEQYKLALASKDADPKVRLNLALAYYKAADYSAATEELEKVYGADPENIQPALLLADCELRRGENKRVIELLSPLRAHNTSDLGIAYLLGTALVRDKQTEQGQIVINQILSGGDSAEARLLMGTTKFGANEFTPALADLAKAVELNPELPGVYSYYGLALYATGDLDASRKAFLAALQRDPTDFESNLHVGMMLRQDGDLEKSLALLQRALEVRTENLAVRYQIALTLMDQGQTARAREELEAVIKAAPSFTEAHVSLSIVYYREKRKADGDRERATVQRLNAEKQATEPGAKAVDAEAAAGKPVGAGAVSPSGATPQ